LKERVHSRTIRIDTFETDGDTLLVEGSLRDERFHASRAYSRSGTVDPGLIHDMIVRMTLSLPGLKIMNIEADMPVIPHPDCAEIKDAVQKLQHIEIKPGFTDEVQRRFGKTQGCLHMMNLILAMGSAAVQGMWTAYACKSQAGAARMPEADNGILLDSCWLWRQDGPFVKRMKKRAADRHE